MATLFGMFPFLKTLFADGGYQGSAIFESNYKSDCPAHLDVEIVKRSDRVKGFVVLPPRYDKLACNFQAATSSSAHSLGIKLSV